MAEEVMVEGYKVRHGPKKADRDWPCCFFPVQILGQISEQVGPRVVGIKPGELLAQGCCQLSVFA